MTWPGASAAAPAVLAHVAEAPRGWAELAGAWTPDPLVLVALVAAGGIYRRGVRNVRRELRPGRGLRWWEPACFWTGWATLALALLSPLHRWGQALFAAHMTQHELLMLVAAPLLVLGRPVVALMFALPRSDARQFSRIARRPGWRAAWRFLSHPLSAWLLHAAALWAWHTPALYQATLTNDLLHHAQHACFFGSALLFWWAVLHGRRGALGAAAGVLYLFTTMMHSGLLGALITFADALVYPAYRDTAGAWGMTPLEDQQLGGLIMWVPAGFVYVAAALLLIGSWLRRAERQEGKPGLVGGSRAATYLLLAIVLGMNGCSDAAARFQRAAALTGGDPHRGRDRVREVGCTACHVIPGVPSARAHVGPPLAGIATRGYLGGVLPNEPENMVRWLMDPPAHAPRTVMPNLRLTEHQARDLAAYLYTLTDAHAR